MATFSMASIQTAAADPRVGGDIGVRYDALGGAAGLLGEPLTGEVGTPNGRGAYVSFQRGGIWWSPQSGAREVHGSILTEWGRTGWEGGPLGFPITDETGTPNGRGAYNAFQGGSVYWSPPSGAHEVHGMIRDAYAWSGWENGVLGFPITGEVRTPNGKGAYNAFQGGSIYWSPTTGAHVVHGAIRDAWAAQGWEGGALGFPTSSEFDIPGGKRVNFQRGYIEWSAATGARVNAPIAVPAPPPASTGGGVIGGTLAVPGEVNLDGLVLRAESVRRVAPPTTGIGYTAGDVPIEVVLTIRNTTQGLWDPFDLVAVTYNGAEAEQVFASGLGYGAGFGDASLAPGQSRTGRYLFSAPPSGSGDVLVEVIIYDVQTDRHVARFSTRL
ncbi:hypothetical protein GCM10009528_25720 [Kineococcus aurantiacus]